jgi:hypothetical protein
VTERVRDEQVVERNGNKLKHDHHGEKKAPVRRTIGDEPVTLYSELTPRAMSCQLLSKQVDYRKTQGNNFKQPCDRRKERRD